MNRLHSTNGRWQMNLARDLPTDILDIIYSFIDYKSDMDAVIKCLARRQFCKCDMCEYGTEWRDPITWIAARESSFATIFSSTFCDGCGAPFSFVCIGRGYCETMPYCYQCAEMKILMENEGDREYFLEEIDNGLRDSSRARMYLTNRYVHR